MFKDTDDWVNKEITRHYSSNAYYLLPSQRFLQIEQVKNLRFKGRYGPHELNLYVHPQVLFRPLPLEQQLPQDAIALIIQCLFPSPDGVLLIANQAYSDPLSKISPVNIAGLLRDLETYKQKDSNDINTQKDLIIIFISRILNEEAIDIKQKYEDLHNYFHEFPAHSYKLNFIKKLYEYLRDNPEVIEEPFTINDPNWIDQLAKTSLFEKFINVQHIPINELNYYWQFSKLYNNKKRKKCIDKDLEQYKKQIFYEENSQFYQAMVFAEALLQAFELQEKAEDNLPYPQDILQCSLMAFMWLKATNVEDVIAFYATLFDSPVEEVEKAFSSSYTSKEYQTKKESLLNDPTLFNSKIINNPEILSFIGKGFELYDSSFSPLLQYRSIPYEPKKRKSRLKGTYFPDCVETSIRNFLNIISRTVGTGSYIYNGTLLGASEEVTSFYEQYQTVNAIFSSDAFKVWGNLLAELPDVVYCKPSNNQTRTFEVHPGILNSLKILSHLLKSQSLSTWVNQARLEDKEALMEASKQLTQHLQRDKYNLTVKVDDELRWDNKIKDFFGTLIFQVNDQDYFKWVHETGHSYIKYVNMYQSDWRKGFNVDIDKLSNQVSLFILPWFMKIEDFNSVKKLPVKEQLSFFWSCNLEDEEVWLKVLELNIAEQDLRLKKFAYQILQSIENLDDHHATTQIAQLIYNMSTRKSPPLSDKDLAEILPLLPTIMRVGITLISDTGSEIPNYPFMLWAYEMGGSNIFKGVYDVRTDFSLIFYSLPEEKLTTARGLLEEIKKFRKIECFDVSGILEKDTKSRDILLDAVKYLPEIEEIHLYFNFFSSLQLMNILEALSNKKLNRIDISYNNVANASEVIELYKYFLMHFKGTTLKMAGLPTEEITTLEQMLKDQELVTDRLILQ